MNATTSSSTVTDLKWGLEVTKLGFQIVPDAIFKYQAVLGRDENGSTQAVSSPELVVLLNVLMHWWTRETIAFPSPQAIATRIGIDRRSVDRAVDGLVKKMILKKDRVGGVVIYDPSPLVERLQQLVVEQTKK